MLTFKNKRLITLAIMLALVLTLIPTTVNAGVDPSNPDGWQWYKYNNSRENNAVTDSPTIINPLETNVQWAYKHNNSTLEKSITPPLISGKYAYAGVDNRVIQIDIETGTETELSKKRASLYKDFKGSVSYATKPPLYAEGKIFLQYSDGRILAVDAETLEPLWESESVGKLQTISNISYGKIDGVGYLYLGTWQQGQKGYLFCVALDSKGFYDGGKKKKVTWKFAPDDDSKFAEASKSDEKVGFYWSGAYVSERYIAIGTDSKGSNAAFYTLNPKTGETIDSIYKINGTVKSSVSYDGGYAYFTSKDDISHKGYLNKIKIDERGKISEHKELELDGAASGTPTVYKGRVYVGVQGKKYLDGDGHSVAVIDGEKMEKIYSVPTPGFPAESILLSTAYENHKFNDSPDGTGRVYLYFTCNKKPGTIYSFYDTPSTRESHVNDMSKLEFVKLSPAYREYNISSVITDRDGNLYFKNDSNHLFKVKSNKSYLDSMKLEAIDGTITMDKGMGLSPSDDFDSRISEYTGKQEGTSKAKLILKPAEGAKAEVNGIPYEDKPMEVSVKPDEKTVIEVTVTKDSSKRIYKIILRPKGTSADLKGIFVNYEVNVPPWTDGEFNVEIDKSFTSGVTDYSTILNEELKKKGGNIWFVADDPNSKIKVIPVENWDEARLNKDGYIPINSSKNMYQGGATFFSKLYPKDWNRDAKISIEVTSENGKASKKYNFTISNQYYVSGVQLNKDNISLETGKKEQLKPTVLPDNATNKEVTWKSSNNKIAYVDWRGNVKGISPGEAYITVTTKDKGYTAICKVTVVGGNADINPEWMQEEDGSWYVEQNGEKKTGWFEDKDTYPGWYYFDKTGRMQTGWVEVDGIWYYMDKSGKMSTGWLQQGGTWYYLKSSGAMATGWQDVGGTWYFFEKSGAMSTGWLQQGSTWYYLKSSGAMATGWLQQGGTWYYLKSSGAMATGWEQIGGTWYKFANNGAWIS